MKNVNVCALATLGLLLVMETGCSSRTQIPTTIQLTKSADETIQFVGEGRLSHPAQYIELSVTVKSECYRTPLAASQASDRAAAQILKSLRQFADERNPKDGVFSEGGFSAPYSRYVQSSRATVCQGTFQKTNVITLKSSKIAAFSKGFDSIQQQIFSTLRQPGDMSSERGVTFASLSKPQARLYYETREKLEQQALAHALKNARLKFESAGTMACGISNYQILGLEESDPRSGGRPIAYGRSTPTANGNHNVEFDAIWINKLLTVKFRSQGGTCKLK